MKPKNWTSSSFILALSPYAVQGGYNFRAYRGKVTIPLKATEQYFSIVIIWEFSLVWALGRKKGYLMHLVVYWWVCCLRLDDSWRQIDVNGTNCALLGVSDALPVEVSNCTLSYLLTLTVQRKFISSVMGGNEQEHWLGWMLLLCSSFKL